MVRLPEPLHRAGAGRVVAGAGARRPPLGRAPRGPRVRRRGGRLAGPGDALRRAGRPRARRRGRRRGDARRRRSACGTRRAATRGPARRTADVVRSGGTLDVVVVRRARGSWRGSTAARARVRAPHRRDASPPTSRPWRARSSSARAISRRTTTAPSAPAGSRTCSPCRGCTSCSCSRIAVRALEGALVRVERPRRARSTWGASRPPSACRWRGSTPSSRAPAARRCAPRGWRPRCSSRAPSGGAPTRRARSGCRSAAMALRRSARRVRPVVPAVGRRDRGPARVRDARCRERGSRRGSREAARVPVAPRRGDDARRVRAVRADPRALRADRAARRRPREPRSRCRSARPSRCRSASCTRCSRAWPAAERGCARRGDRRARPRAGDGARRSRRRRSRARPAAHVVAARRARRGRSRRPSLGPRGAASSAPVTVGAAPAARAGRAPGRRAARRPPGDVPRRRAGGLGHRRPARRRGDGRRRRGPRRQPHRRRHARPRAGAARAPPGRRRGRSS